MRKVISLLLMVALLSSAKFFPAQEAEATN
jgi:hypothetical protein